MSNSRRSSKRAEDVKRDAQKAIAHTEKQYARLAPEPANRDLLELTLDELGTYSLDENELELELLTAIATKTASPQEQQIWDKLCKEKPSMLHILAEYQEAMDDPSISITPLLDFGAQLHEHAAPLPDDFWDMSTDLHKEQAGETQVDERLASAHLATTLDSSSKFSPEHRVELAEPTPFTEQKHSFDESAASAQWHWLGSTLAALALFIMLWPASFNPLQLPSPAPLQSSPGLHSIGHLRVRSKSAGKMYNVTLLVRFKNKTKIVKKTLHVQSGMQLRIHYSHASRRPVFMDIFFGGIGRTGEHIYPPPQQAKRPLKPGIHQYLPNGLDLTPSPFPERLWVCIHTHTASKKKLKQDFQNVLKNKQTQIIQSISTGCMYQRNWIFFSRP